jgi:hypothetical protein
VGVGARSIARLFPDLSILEKCLKRARLMAGEAAQSFGQVSI